MKHCKYEHRLLKTPSHRWPFSTCIYLHFTFPSVDVQFCILCILQLFNQKQLTSFHVSTSALIFTYCAA